jgi:hypothetical protein
MKKMNTLLSFLIAFSFVTVAFGQDDDALTRTTPVISSTGGNGGSNHRPGATTWKTVKVTSNSVTLKLTKSIDCAVLQGITATTDEGVSLKIFYNKNDLKKLQTGVPTPIVVKFLEDFSDKKVSIGLDWDLKGCDENTLGSGGKTKQTQVKSLVASSTPTPSTSSGSYSSSDSFNVILKGGATPSESTKKIPFRDKREVTQAEKDYVKPVIN